MSFRSLAVVSMSILLLVVTLELVGLAEDKPAPDTAEVNARRTANLKAMREVAETIKVTLADEPESKPLPLIADALYRYDDPTREMNDGSIWAYGRTGSPAMLLTLAQYRHPDGARSWIMEWNSLADGKIVAKGVPAPFTPAKPGLEFKPLPDAPPPDKTPQIRTRQVKDLSRRFTGFEYFGDTPYELRLLTQPIHRYANSEQGVLDGGLFVFAHGGNPEVVLAIEARKTAEKETWMYAFSRVAYAELRIKLDEMEIWKVPQLKGNDVGPNDPYWLSWLAIPPGE